MAPQMGIHSVVNMKDESIKKSLVEGIQETQDINQGQDFYNRATGIQGESSAYNGN